jgi:hypothetical protein
LQTKDDQTTPNRGLHNHSMQSLENRFQRPILNL